MPVEHKCGIYVIEQIGTDRFYIGSSRAIRNRWYQHKRELNLGVHHSNFLQRTWTKHGADVFKFWILEECGPDELISKEQEYILAFKPVFNSVLAASIGQISKELATKRTHCPHGHEYTPENTYYGKLRGKSDKRCKSCNAERVSNVYSKETPEQRAARAKRVKDYYNATVDARKAKAKEWQLRTKERKRLYDIAYRERKKATG